MSFSDVLQSLFGGSNQTANSSSTQTNYTNPVLSNLAGPLSGGLTSLMQLLQGGGTTGVNGGITPIQQAPMTAQEGNLLKTIGSQVGPGTASAGWINDVLAGKYMPGSPNGNPAIAGAITAAQRPTLDNLRTTLSQALPGQFAAAGQEVQPNKVPGSGGSSAFDNAAALAFQSAANTSTDIASNIANNAFNTGSQQQTAAAGLDQNEVNNTISALNAAALPRTIAQNGINAGVAQHNTNIQSLLQVLQTLGAVQAPTLAANSTSSAKGTSSKGIIPDVFKPV